MTLNEKIIAYLGVKNISFTFTDYQTEQPEGQEDQIVNWDSVKLGAKPSQEQLDAAWASYVPPTYTPTKEELLAQLQALQAQIQALS